MRSVCNVPFFCYTRGMEKDFDELTIADDYMFYRVMEDTDICKTLLNRVLQGKVETITDIELQKTIDDAGRAKGVRFDVWAKIAADVFMT